MSDLNQRIEAMYQGDKRGAWLFVAALWIVILFVLFMAWPHIPDAGVRIVSLIAAAAVLIFASWTHATAHKGFFPNKTKEYSAHVAQIVNEN